MLKAGSRDHLQKLLQLDRAPSPPAKVITENPAPQTPTDPGSFTRADYGLLTNLVCLCPTHHRALHHADFTIDGNPEDGTLQFRDRHGRPIEPPQTGATLPHPPPPTQLTYHPPSGERLNPRDFGWN